MASVTECNQSDIKITVDTYTNSPTIAWERIRVKSKHTNIPREDRLDPNTTSVSPDKVRVVCISDTHSKLENTIMEPDIIPYGDILLHAGDFTMKGEPNAVYDFNTFLGKLPHKHKIVIAGNHEISFDDYIFDQPCLNSAFGSKEKYVSQMKNLGVTNVKDLLTNCTYLEDSMVTVCGNQTSMVLHGYGDVSKQGNHVGCVELLNIVQKKVQPKYHIYGHIHEGYGMSTDGHTTFINASTCTTKYHPTNPAIVFDYPLPAGHTKDEPPIVHPEGEVKMTSEERKKKFHIKSKIRSLLTPGKKQA